MSIVIGFVAIACTCIVLWRLDAISLNLMNQWLTNWNDIGTSESDKFQANNITRNRRPRICPTFSSRSPIERWFTHFLTVMKCASCQTDGRGFQTNHTHTELKCKCTSRWWRQSTLGGWIPQTSDCCCCVFRPISIKGLNVRHSTQLQRLLNDWQPKRLL